MSALIWIGVVAYFAIHIAVFGFGALWLWSAIRSLR